MMRTFLPTSGEETVPNKEPDEEFLLKLIEGPDVVGYAYNPNYSGGRDERIAVCQPGQTFSDTLSQK
jgi:hypothetical protein